MSAPCAGREAERQGQEPTTWTRRRWIRAATVAAGAPAGLAACSDASAPVVPGGAATRVESYEAAAARTWRLADETTNDRSLIGRELVRLATLAPSSHNTQCWQFHVEDKAITILPDAARRCPAVDPDDHHLFVSLGCAAENLVHAALAHGLKATPAFLTVPSDRIDVTLEPTPAVASPLFRAIAERQCTRAVFDGRPVSGAELKLLEQAGSGPGVRVLLLTDKPALEGVLEHVVQGNTAQMADPAFVAELKTWIRFGSAEAVRAADGLYAVSSGNPALPRWLGSRLFGRFFTAKNENDKYALHLRSSAGVAVFVSDVDDKAHWVEAGRCYERFALQATALGIRNAMLNQPVEVASLRPQFAAFLGIGGRRPDLVVRFGRGPVMPRSLRRATETVLV